MSFEHYVEQLARRRAERREALAKIRFPAHARAYQQRVRRAIARALGARGKRTPLNARVTGRIEADGFSIDKLLFASAPGRLVSAHLYLPVDAPGPVPAVLQPCGHSAAGKSAPIYQEASQDLVRAGYAVLTYDPIHQGERRHYRELRPGWVDRPCHGHNQLGKQMELVGDFFGSWRLHDGRRALDYLRTRPEIDAQRIGMSGCSGGGTMTTWTAGVEERLSFFAPSCFVTSYWHNLRNELPQDVEQCPPGILAAGLEQVDFLIAAAPRPIILLGERYDFFDRRGLAEAYDELRRFYRLLGAASARCARFLGEQSHGFHPPQRQALIRFLRKQVPSPAKRRTGEAEALPERELAVCDGGDVHRAGGQPVYRLLAEEADRLARRRIVPTGATLRRAVARLLGVRARMTAPDYRVISREYRENGRYRVESEDGVRCELYRVLREGAEGARGWGASLECSDAEPQVYLPHMALREDIDLPFVQRLRRSNEFFAVEPRGMGPQLLDDLEDGFRVNPYGRDYMRHAYELMFGGSLFGRRVHDLLRVLDLLRSVGGKRFQLSGRGQGALLVLFAGLLRDDVAQVTTLNAPDSYQSLVDAPLSEWPAAAAPRGILKLCDLQDLRRELGGRLRELDSWGTQMTAERRRRGAKRQGVSS